MFLISTLAISSLAKASSESIVETCLTGISTKAKQMLGKMCLLNDKKSSLTCQAKRTYKYVKDLSEYLQKLHPSVNVEDSKFKKAIEIMKKIDESLLSEKLVGLQEDQNICGDQNFVSSTHLIDNNKIILAMQHHKETLGEYGFTFERVFEMLRVKEKSLLTTYTTAVESCFTEKNLVKIQELEDQLNTAAAAAGSEAEGGAKTAKEDVKNKQNQEPNKNEHKNGFRRAISGRWLRKAK